VPTIEVGDRVYLYENDDEPIGTVRAVHKGDFVLQLASGAEYELPLDVVESAVHHRVLLAAHRLDKKVRDVLDPTPPPPARR
jgi:hypothetical protein